MSFVAALLFAVLALGALVTLFGAFLASRGKWHAANAAGHVVTMVTGITFVLGLAGLVVLGAYAKLRPGFESIGQALNQEYQANKVREIAEIITTAVNLTLGSGLVALFSMTLWMVARRHVKKEKAAARARTGDAPGVANT